MKIVIAEEDGAIRRIIEEAKALPSDEVIGLTDPDDLGTAWPDPDLQVLIIGSTLPDRARVNLCQRIRGREPGEPYVYVIAMVPPDAVAERLETLEGGADDAIASSCDSKEFLARVEVARRICGHDKVLRDRSDELERIRLDLERRNAGLAEVASSDPLTGLRNRRFFREALDSQVLLACRKGLPLSMVMIDVDQFKGFNDQFGHPAGDDVLQEVGVLLRSCVRDHDVVARYGGEEFAVLLPATEENESLPLADRLRLAIASHPWPLRPITISLGVSTLCPSALQPADLIDQADQALYYSKALGRNRATHASHLPQPVSTLEPPSTSDHNLNRGLIGSPSAPRTPCEANAG